MDLFLDYFEFYEPKAGDIIIDGGACFGVFALYAAQFIGEKGRVIAFEPDRHNYDKLLKNIELNSLNNVTVINKGLWSEEGQMEIFEHPGGFASSLFPYDSLVKNDLKCSVTSIDAILGQLSIRKVDFIKMDIEGAELEAIKGAERTLKTFPVNLAIASYHVLDGETTSVKLEKLLATVGYESYTDHKLQYIITYSKRK
jgi:FkbM family methyltransferase